MHTSDAIVAESLSQPAVGQNSFRFAVHPRLVDGSAWPSRNLRGATLTALTLIATDLLSAVASFTLARECLIAISRAAQLEWGTGASAFGIATCLANIAVGLYPGSGLSTVAE